MELVRELRKPKTNIISEPTFCYEEDIDTSWGDEHRIKRRRTADVKKPPMSRQSAAFNAAVWECAEVAFAFRPNPAHALPSMNSTSTFDRSADALYSKRLQKSRPVTNTCVHKYRPSNRRKHLLPTSSRTFRQIPTEIWDEVFDLLNCCDVKSCRRACRTFARIGGSFLWKPFTFRPDREDIRRFFGTTRLAIAAESIHALRFEIGVGDIAHIAERLGEQLAAHHNSEIQRSEMADEDFDHEMITGMRDDAINDYVAWNTRHYDSKQSYTNHMVFTAMFKRVARLDEITITYRYNHFESRLLIDAWLDVRSNYLYERQCEEFAAIVSALAASDQKINTFSHDQLPITFFAQPQASLRSQAACLTNLRTIKIALASTEIPARMAWTGLGMFLQSLPFLKSITLGFQTAKGDHQTDMTWRDTEFPHEWYIPMWKMLDLRRSWRYLAYLHLDGMLVCEDGLWQLLDLHREGLTTLKLSNIALWKGTWGSLLTKIRDRLALKVFDVGGIIKGFHSFSEVFRLPPIQDDLIILDCCGSVARDMQNQGYGYRRPVAYRCGIDGCHDWGGTQGCSCQETADYLTKFVLERDSVWYGEARSLDKPAREFHSGMCTECFFTAVELDDLWDAEEENELWELASNDPFPTDEDGNEIVESYDGGGFDVLVLLDFSCQFACVNSICRFDFDFEGNTEHGIHHSDILEQIGRYHGITAATCVRELQRAILDRLPRYQAMRHAIHVDGRNVYKYDIENLRSRDSQWARTALRIRESIEQKDKVDEPSGQDADDEFLDMMEIDDD